MANYCNNFLELDCSFEESKEFLNNIKDSEGEVNFEILFPMPDNVEDPFKWGEDNWGTEGNGGSGSTFSYNTVSFYTAWTPPIEFLDTVSKQYPNIIFTLYYFEPGCDFAGIAIIQNGKRKEDCWDTCDSQLARDLFGNEFIEEITGI